MFVCVCHAVSDRTIRQAVARGATAEEIARSTRAGTSCGCCADDLARVIATSGPCKPGAPCAGCPGAARSAA